MSPHLLIALCGLALLMAFGLTLWVERQADRLGLVQHPNHRSSHTQPTPRGGGVAIATAIVVAAAILCGLGATALVPIVVGTAMIAGLGFADDLADLPAALRFPIQALVIVGVIVTLADLPPIPLLGGIALSGLVLAFLVAVVGLWWLNLFNFIDGIDGLAASQAILLLVAGNLIWWSSDATAPANPAFWLALAAAAATAGFLLRNWPPARIFMGDAGSNALALVIFSVALLTIADDRMAYASWLILPAVLVTDATVTLLRRLARGERPWHAHRRHGYQQLSRRWGHRNTTLLYGALTLGWAAPISLIAQHNAALSWIMAVVAYLPLIGFVIWTQAGSAAER